MSDFHAQGVVRPASASRFEVMTFRYSQRESEVGARWAIPVSRRSVRRRIRPRRGVFENPMGKARRSETARGRPARA